MTKLRLVVYDKTTGNRLYDCSYDRQFIEPTLEQLHDIVIDLQPLDINFLGLLRFEDGQYEENFRKYPFHVDITQNPPVIVWDISAPIGASLEDVQNAKIAQLTEFEQQASATFQSSALGSVHTYLSDEKAMGKFNAEYTFVNSAEYDGLPILWYTIEEGGVVHTKEQFNQVWLDGRNYIAANFNKWDSLVKQVKACTSVEQVNAIKW
jgi:hypothetical protein